MAAFSYLVAFVMQNETQTSKANSMSWSDVIAAVSVGVAFLSVGVALLVALLTFLNNRATLRESRRTERRKIIEQMINEFYGPLLSYLNIIKALHSLFAAGKPKGFRTVTYLLERNQEHENGTEKKDNILTESDKKLLANIIETEKKIEDLIIAKGGLADDPALTFDYVPDPTETDTELGSPLLTANSLLNPKSLIEKLKNENNPLIKHLRSRFDANTNKLLNSYAIGTQPDQALLNTLVKDINDRLIENNSLYDETAFKQVKLSKDIKTLAKQSLEPNNQALLNRMLLESAFPHEITKRLNLGLLAIAIIHFRILRMAYEGNFHKEVERFKDFVYPRELDAKILDRIESLRNEARNL